MGTGLGWEHAPRVWGMVEMLVWLEQKKGAESNGEAEELGQAMGLSGCDFHSEGVAKLLEGFERGNKQVIES